MMFFDLRLCWSSLELLLALFRGLCEAIEFRPREHSRFFEVTECVTIRES
jgi:hypothetical protein